MNKEIQKSIFSTLAFFDMFDYPLTVIEIHKFLFNPPKEIGVMEINQIINEELKNKIEKKDGFYFLKNRQKNIETKQVRYKESFSKYKKAKKTALIFSKIPFVELIAIGNYIPVNNSKASSDIDFFIITKKNRIWITRFICIIISQIFGWRPTEKNHKDKICLTFFTSEDNLNFEHLLLDENDIYFIYWLANLYPIYNNNKTFEKFMESNAWIKKYLPNFEAIIPSQKRRLKKEMKCIFMKILNFNWCNKITKKIQLKMLPKNLKEMTNKDTRVIVNDKMLKFHVNDRREEYSIRFKKKMRNL